MDLRLADALVALANGMALERLKDPVKMPVDLTHQMIASLQHSYLKMLD
jgi:hypothetical protein